MSDRTTPPSDSQDPRSTHDPFGNSAFRAHERSLGEPCDSMPDEAASGSFADLPDRPGHRPVTGSTGSDGAPGALCDETVLDELLEEFTERCRDGERISVAEYAGQHPGLAAEIRELFPTVLAMEQLNRSKSGPASQGRRLPLPPSEQLGDYRVVAEIARGGMGIVYEAEQVTLGRRVAVKVLPQQVLRNEKDVLRFQREAQTAAKLHHANIVPVFGVGQHDGIHYLVMQLIRGVGLDEILSELRRIVVHPRLSDADADAAPTTARTSCVCRSANLLLSAELRSDSRGKSAAAKETLAIKNGIQDTVRSPAEDAEWRGLGSRSKPALRRASARRLLRPATGPAAADRHPIRAALDSEYYRNVARIGMQAADALGYAHRHDTLHRDIKPGNLLLDEEGVVWIADFGLAKAIEHDAVTWTGDIVGTLSYMAPERFEGQADALGDIYSLGLTLHELLTFERLFDGPDRAALMNRILNEPVPPPRKRNPGVPRDLETIVLKAVSKNPADRYQSADDLAEDLKNFLADRPIRARPVSAMEHGVRWCRRNRTITGLAAAVLWLMATVLVVTGIGYVRETTQRQRAEKTSRLALNALDEIYTQFAPPQITLGVSTSTSSAEEDVLLDHTQLPLSKDVALLLENLLRFYAELSRQADNSGTVTFKAIVANRRVGDIHRRLGDADKARDAYDRALTEIDTLAPEQRGAAETSLEIARVYNGQGIVFHKTRSFEQALAAHRRTLDLIPGSAPLPAHRFERARAFYLSHIVQRDWKRERRRDGGEPWDRSDIQQAIDVLLSLRESNPQEAQYRSLLATCYLAAEASRHAKSAALTENQREALAIFEELVTAAPDVDDYRYQLGEAYEALEWQRIHCGREGTVTSQDLQASESRLRRAIEVTDPLEATQLQIGQFQLLRKKLYHHLAGVLEQLGRLEEARDFYELAIAKQRRVIELSDDQPMHTVCLHDVQQQYARLLRDSRRSAEAQALLENSSRELAAITRLPAVRDNERLHQFVENVRHRTNVTLCCLLNELGRKDDADKILQKAERAQ